MAGKPTMMYYGETQCVALKRDGERCTNKAYYIGNLCGVHGKDKTKLPKNPNAAAILKGKRADHETSVELAKEENVKHNRIGILCLEKMKMMKATPDRPGYIKVYPNYQDGNKRDGLGMPSLSPKSIGPIYHGQPGLPPAINLENLHQGNKCYSKEMADGAPGSLFMSRRIEMYNDKVPWRHKQKRYSDITDKHPLFSVWRERDGTERQLTYIESRQIYCTLYEHMIEELQDYIKLQGLLKEGYNLQICGYDAYEPPAFTAAAFEKCYLDPSKPFGHELVLAAMLLDFKPWIKHTFIL